MMRSMFTAITGLNTHQNKMDVIANNIANVNTIAFKSARVTFADVFYQTSSGGSGANAATGRGGTNPMQVGLGVGLSSIDNIMSQGAAMNTGNELDLMINGDSFFIVGDSSGVFFTRAGAFRLDNELNIVTASGYKLYGWNSVYNETTGKYEIQKGAVEPLNVLGGEHLTAMGQSTTLASVTGNLSASDCGAIDPATGLGEKSITQNLTFYDSLGNAYTIDVDFTLINRGSLPAGDPLLAKSHANYNNWVASFDNTAYCNGTAVKINLDDIVLNFDASGNLVDINASVAGGAATATTPGNRYIITNFIGANSGDPVAGTTFVQEIASTLGLQVDFDFPIHPTTGNPTTDHGFVLDFSKVTATTGKSSIKLLKDNGHAGGELTDWSIGSDGIIRGVYSNGDVRILGQVAVANFQNPAGLEKVGDNLYQTTANSGDFNGIGDDVSYGGGSFIPGSLEMSNVDLSTEFTEMITTQRGFQANSRIITTSDELLQELVNLKR